jgi:hypothetical protein
MAVLGGESRKGTRTISDRFISGFEDVIERQRIYINITVKV